MLFHINDYISAVANYAGYKINQYDKTTSEGIIYEKIIGSIDNDRPILLQYENQKQWVIIFGYDNKVFFTSKWYEKISKVMILGEKIKPNINIFNKGAQIAKYMLEYHLSVGLRPPALLEGEPLSISTVFRSS